ncbi:MAG: Ig-like domain-containing protein, partial [Planctomycetota bacterium]|nr:Ig-like domain-containing protein [Planctomycetota bacterium]
QQNSYGLRVRVTDQGGLTFERVLTVQIINVENEFAPVLNDANFTVAENRANGTLVGTVTATDGDVANGGFAYAITAGNALGIFAIDNSGQITVADKTNLNRENVAQVVLTVQVSDNGPGAAKTDIATVTITIADENEFAPVLNDTGFTVAENRANGTPVGTVMATDADATNGGLSYAITGGNTLGIFAIDNSGQITVADKTNLDRENVAQVVLTVQVSDHGPGTPRTDTAMVTITVANVNESPVANDDSQSTAEDVAVLIPWLDLFQNDSDVDSPRSQWSVAAVGAVTHGTVSNEPTSQRVRFVPEQDYRGLATFVYTLADGDGLTAEATVTVSVATVNDPPLPASDTVATDEDVTLDIPWLTLLANDQDVDSLAAGWTVAYVRGSVNGTATNLPESQFVRFVPAKDAVGQGRFVYALSDGDGGVAEATVTVTLRPLNDPPLAGDDEQSTDEDTLLGIPWSTLFQNDSDVDSPRAGWTVNAVGSAIHGVVTNDSPQQRVTFQPEADFHGRASFLYTLDDGQGGQIAATMGVDVASVNDRPTAVTLAPAAVAENAAGAVIGTLSASDPDAADTHTFTVSDDRFEIVGQTLKLQGGQSFNLNRETRVSVQVTATDSGQPPLSRTETFVIAVTANPFPWQNPGNRFDVNHDGAVVPVDVLFLIAELNGPTIRQPNGSLPAARAADSQAPYYDINGDGALQPIDVLLVINYINNPPKGAAAGEAAPGDDPAAATPLAGDALNLASAIGAMKPTWVQTSSAVGVPTDGAGVPLERWAPHSLRLEAIAPEMGRRQRRGIPADRSEVWLGDWLTTVRWDLDDNLLSAIVHDVAD